jgi:hypothetical protein
MSWFRSPKTAAEPRYDLRPQADGSAVVVAQDNPRLPHLHLHRDTAGAIVAAAVAGTGRGGVGPAILERHATDAADVFDAWRRSARPAPPPAPAPAALPALPPEIAALGLASLPPPGEVAQVDALLAAARTTGPAPTQTLARAQLDAWRSDAERFARGVVPWDQRDRDRVVGECEAAFYQALVDDYLRPSPLGSRRAAIVARFAPASRTAPTAPESKARVDALTQYMVNRGYIAPDGFKKTQNGGSLADCFEERGVATIPAAALAAGFRPEPPGPPVSEAQTAELMTRLSPATVALLDRRRPAAESCPMGREAP